MHARFSDRRNMIMDQPTRAYRNLRAGAAIPGLIPSPARRRPIISAALFLLSMVALAACGDTGSPATPAPQAQFTSTVALEGPTAAPTEDASGGWQTFKSDADGFAVETPGDLQASTQTANSALGKLTLHFFQLSHGDAQYAVSYADYPVAESDLDPEQLLTNGINSAAQGSAVQNTQQIDVQGHPGIDGEASLQDVAHLWYRGILVHARFYQLIVTAPEENKATFDGEARRFIASFMLLKP
jgi:hypothetical protein